MPHVMLRMPAIVKKSGKSRSQIYLEISRGLFVPLIKLSSRAVAAPEHEVDALNAARIAGKSDEDIRALVVKLEAARASLA